MAQPSADAQRRKYLLDETALPTQWYNIQADLPTPLPPVIHPGTGQPIGPQDLAPLFPMELIKQEVSQERWLDIPRGGASGVASVASVRPCFAPAGWNRRSTPRHIFTTNMKGSVRWARISPIRLYRKPITIKPKGYGG